MGQNWTQMSRKMMMNFMKKSLTQIKQITKSKIILKDIIQKKKKKILAEDRCCDYKPSKHLQKAIATKDTLLQNGHIIITSV